MNGIKAILIYIAIPFFLIGFITSCTIKEEYDGTPKYEIIYNCVGAQCDIMMDDLLKQKKEIAQLESEVNHLMKQKDIAKADAQRIFDMLNAEMGNAKSRAEEYKLKIDELQNTITNLTTPINTTIKINESENNATEN